MPAGAGSVVTDSSVPEGHKGLHGFLYGDGGAEVHDGADRQYQSHEVSNQYHHLFLHPSSLPFIWDNKS